MVDPIVMDTKGILKRIRSHGTFPVHKKGFEYSELRKQCQKLVDCNELRIMCQDKDTIVYGLKE
jgi:hypothetical protein